jgi:hypothetical protein
MVEYLLEFGGGVRSLLLIEVCLTAQVGDLEKSGSLIGSGRLQQPDRLSRIASPQFNQRLNERKGSLIQKGVFLKPPGQLANDCLRPAEIAAGSQRDTRRDHCLMPVREVECLRALLSHQLAVTQLGIPRRRSCHSLRNNVFQVSGRG